ncbi:hypothetical protein SAMN05216229_102137 [Geopseudomonas sagittaria]|uniref:MAE-28990/MAE-18760-like HEPN domain-containing protein n=1 Tax=Geopseudomonas sagittaria TaxID=1135990 RepID=A0A1I5Q1F0_9GAMM|nr:hypothetical protein [Pseudomonas sagittaria]SFP39850.1 hypothetical protein SAMN05216229_102137 [Pseudomonas sagittaria]
MVAIMDSQSELPVPLGIYNLAAWELIMTLGPIPDYLREGIRKNFLAGLKGNRSLDTYELDLFQWFMKETEETWARMNSEEQKCIQGQIDSGVEVNDSGALVVEYYRKRMRASHVMHLASILEGAMKRECDRVTLVLAEQVLFKPSELKGDAWSARRAFLERHGKFCVPDNLWGPIRNLLAVRNALAHHGDDISTLMENEVQKLRKIPGVSVDNFELSIEVGFVDGACKAVRDVAEFLHAQINELIDRGISQKGIA